METRDALIVIGREYGSGGRALGRLLSRRMGIPVFDKELLSEAAKEFGISLPHLVRSDERKPSLLRSVMEGAFGFSPGSQGVQMGSLANASLYAMQSKVIEKLAEKGGAIFVGRTADYVLRDNPRLLSIFVHSAPELRAHRIMERRECDNEAQAMDLARRQDRLRQSYYNFYTGRSWGMAANYHLSLDLGKTGLEKAAEIIINMVLSM